MINSLPPTKGVYLQLFHGRGNPNKDMNDWGTTGPVLGPLRYCHITYGDDWKAENINGSNGGRGCLIDNLLYYDGVYYGDWSIAAADLIENTPDLKKRIKKLDWRKAKDPKSKSLIQSHLTVLVWKAYPDPVKRIKQIERFLELEHLAVKPVGDDILDITFYISPERCDRIKKRMNRKSAPDIIIMWEVKDVLVNR